MERLQAKVTELETLLKDRGEAGARGEGGPAGKVPKLGLGKLGGKT